MDVQQAAKGISINLTASGPAAMLSVWFLSIAALGVWGGPHATAALSLLGMGGSVLIGGLIVSGTFRGVN